MLSRQLADAAHYPAIDLTGSISRLMSNLMTPVQQEMANRLRRLWTLYQENKDLIQVGAYEVGSNSELDMAIRLRPQIEALLQQSSDAAVTMRQSQQMLAELME